METEAELRGVEDVLCGSTSLYLVVPLTQDIPVLDFHETQYLMLMTDDIIVMRDENTCMSFVTKGVQSNTSKYSFLNQL